MWAQHHSHFKTLTPTKGQERFWGFLNSSLPPTYQSAKSMSSPWPRMLQLRIMTQVQKPHSQGSEKFEAYPIHLCQHLIFWSLWSRRRDIIMTSSWLITFLDFAPSAYEWCAFLDSSKGPQPNETWQDCPHHGGESSNHWTMQTKKSVHERNQQRMWAYVSSASFALSKHSHPQRVRKDSEGFSIHLCRPHINLPKACHRRDQECCSSESWHRFRSLIPRGRRSLRLTQFIFASISFFDHFGAEDVTSSWHHHDSSHFWTLHHQPMSGVHSWTHQKGLSRTRPDKIVLIMEVKVLTIGPCKPRNLFTSGTSRECEHMWAQHHSHFQNTHTHKGSGKILRFSQFISAAHISICQKHVIAVTKKQLRIMTQVQKPHSQGSEKFEAYPIHLCQHLIFWSLWSRRRDIIMTSSWLITFLDFAPSAYEWCAFLDSSKGPQPNETWQDCPHHGGESSNHWTMQTKKSVHKPNQQRMCICELSIIRTSKHSHPQRVRKDSEVFSIHLCRPHINLPKACHRRDQECCSSESWHRFRSLIPRGRRSLRLTQFIFASISFFDHFGAEDVTSSWHHHDSSHFWTLHHQPMSGVHSWTHQKGLSRTRPDKIVLIMEVKVLTIGPCKPRNLFTSRTSRECEHMWAQHHSHFQNTHTHKGSGKILRFSQFISAAHISICQKHVIAVTKKQLRIMTQVQKPHSQGSEKFEAYPIHLCQHLIFWSLWSRRRDIIMTSSWLITFLDFAPSAYEWCAFLDSSKGPQPNETWQDCPHHGGESSNHWTMQTKKSVHKPNQQRMCICELSIIRTFKTLTPTKGQERFWGFLNSSLPPTYQSAKSMSSPWPRSSSESWHRFRSLIPRGRRSLRLTQFIFASISFFDHFGAEDVTSSWHHHDSSHFWTLHHQPMSGVHSWTHQKGLSRTRPDKIVLIMEVKVLTIGPCKPRNLFTSRTSRECEHMWAQHHSHFQNTHTHKGSGKILRFSQFISAAHISICQKHVIAVTKNCSSESWHRFRSLIPRGRRSLRLTQFIFASISFFDHFGAEDVTSSWHHHDSSHFWTLHHQPMSGVHSWTHQKGLSRTRPDKIVLIMEVKVVAIGPCKPRNLFTSGTSRECEHMWAQHHSHFQNTHTHKGSGKILRFSQFISAAHISICQKHVIAVTKNVAAQNHDTGSEASFPGVGEVWGLPNSSLPASHFLITLEQKTWHHHDIIMTHHISGLCTISLWVVCILGLIKRASAERDLTRLSSSWRWKF